MLTKKNEAAYSLGKIYETCTKCHFSSSICYLIKKLRKSQNRKLLQWKYLFVELSLKFLTEHKVCSRIQIKKQIKNFEFQLYEEKKFQIQRTGKMERQLVKYLA